VPWGLKRLHESGQSHFITFCCYHRLPLLVDTSSKRTFELALERVRRKFGLCVYGYVIMPEHVHLLVNEPARATLVEAIKSLKQGVARRRIGGAEHFWQPRYYDFNIRNHRQFVEKLRYIHRNPVKRGVCARRRVGVEQLSPLRDRRGRRGGARVGMDGPTTRTSSGKALSGGQTAPLKPKEGLNGPPARSHGANVPYRCCRSNKSRRYCNGRWRRSSISGLG